MKMMKALILSLALTVPLSAFALTDDEQVIFTDALRTGKVKVVVRYRGDDKVKANTKKIKFSVVDRRTVR